VIDYLASIGKKALMVVLLYALLANVMVYVYAAAGMAPPSFLMLYPAVQFKEMSAQMNSTAVVGNATISGTFIGQVQQGYTMFTASVSILGLVLNFLMQMIVGLPTLLYEITRAANEYLGAPLGPALMYIASGAGAMLHALALFYVAYTLLGTLRQWL